MDLPIPVANMLSLKIGVDGVIAVGSQSLADLAFG